MFITLVGFGQRLRLLVLVFLCFVCVLREITLLDLAVTLL